MTALERGDGPSRSLGSFRRQLMVLSATVTAFAVVLLVLIVQLVLEQTSSRSVDRELQERADAVIRSAQVSSTGADLVVADASLDAGVAVYDADATLLAGSAPSALAGEYADLAGAQGRETVAVGETSRIRAQPFTLDSGVSGVVVVTERLAPYEEAERYALLVGVGTGLLAVLASAGLAAWVSRRALAPVLTMATTAEAWSEQDLARRFGLGAPTNEITALGQTLDGLLEKVATAIRSEQRLTSELAHELRTPLTAVQGMADLVAMRPDLDPEVRQDVEEIRAGTRRMGETIAGLLDLARSSGPSESSVAALVDAVEEVVRGLGPRGSSVSVDVSSEIVVAMPRTLVLRAVGPVVENAVRLADEVHVSVVIARPGFVGVAVDDDGPGVVAEARTRIFEPGHSGTRAGSGLGLPLARRIARSAGGDVTLVWDDQRPGTRFVIELPLG